MSAVFKFIKREPVLVIAAAAALVSCFFVPPDAGYANYIDFRTLALLYSLMVIVSGLRDAGVFTSLARALCKRVKSVRSVGVLTVCLCFFCSTLITNDVALLTFVPFSAIVLDMTGRSRYLARLVILQTTAANLGSMLTPMGNPQNLYLYSYYQMTFFDFLSVTFPVWAASLLLLLCCCLFLPREPLDFVPGEDSRVGVFPASLCAVLFAVCLLTVVRVLDWYIMLAAVVSALLVLNRDILLKADWLLLLTFAAFFVFTGNLARIDAVREPLQSLLCGREYPVSLAASQVISNVPAALLLSGFTNSARPLILGVNVGGLGTPVASLASLIGLKLYSRSPGAETGRFLLEFTLLNAALLILLSVIAVFLI